MKHAHTPKPIKLAVVGSGRWGKNLVRNFHALDSLYAVCDSDVDRRVSVAAQYPAVTVYSSFEELLDKSPVSAVAVATPAERHHAMALAALESGRDVFVEKPLCLSTDDAHSLVAAARRHRRILMVGHVLRYHPAILKIQELIATGVLGDIEYVYSNRLAMGQIRKQENAIWSFAPHDISVILALLGHLPVQISASGGAYVQPNIANVTVSNLLFANGARAHIFVSWLHPYKEQKLVIIGSKRMIAFEDSSAERKLILYDRHMDWTSGHLEVASSKGEPIDFAAEEPLRLECAHFLECLGKRHQ